MDNAQLIQWLAHRGVTLATAESLTAGGVASHLAEVPGASSVLRGGVVAYCNDVKHQLLDVSLTRLENQGAVDPVVAAQMARGAAVSCGADMGVATTGVAGPEPHQGQPVGTVYVGVAWADDLAQRSGLSHPEGLRSVSEGIPAGWHAAALAAQFDGDRADIRAQSVEAAVAAVEAVISTETPGLPENG